MKVTGNVIRDDGLIQSSFFDKPQYKITKPIRLIELFAGYGSQHLALKYLKSEYPELQVESYKICEWAVKSIQAYKDAHCENDNTNYSKDLTDEQVLNYLFNKGISQNYNEPMTYEQIKRLGSQKQRQIYNNIKATHNLVNIQQVKGSDLEIVDTDTYCYIMTYSYPCQDLSLVGKQQGMAKGSGTRSSLLWEVERVVSELKSIDSVGGGYTLPKILLLENVPQCHSSKNKNDFDKWCNFLTSLGYSNFYQDLNSEDYCMPQNRNRTFMVSILGYENDYIFPRRIKLKLKMKDLLEDDVSEKYYLSQKMITYVLDKDNKQLGTKWESAASNSKMNPYIAYTISCRGASGCQRAGLSNFICDNIDKEIRVRDIKKLYTDILVLRIRKLTPKECFRLMGVKDKDFEKISKNQSDASLYHLAGDSIVVDVLMAIFRQLL